jgi:hypothetical protein
MVLTALKVKNAKPGRHVDGRGLCLLVKESGAATWVLRMQHKGRRRDYGLGSAWTYPLWKPERRRVVLRSKVRAGADPVAERRKARKVIPSFETAARDCYDALKEGWKNRRMRTGYPASKTTYSRISAPSLSIRWTAPVLSPCFRPSGWKSRKRRVACYSA